MIEQTRRVVDHYLQPLAGAPPPAGRQHAEYVLQLSGWDTKDDNVANLLFWLNGPWWIHDHIPVYHGLADRVTLVDEVTGALLCTLFASLPVVPMVSRWTKVYDSLRSFHLGFAVHGIFQKVAAPWTHMGTACNHCILLRVI
jgi:hypothetical protein